MARLIDQFAWQLPALAGLGVGILGTALVSRWTAITAGDVLGFAGAMLGVSVTVWGAIFIEEKKSANERARETKRLAGAIQQVRDARAYIANPVAADGLTPSLALHFRYELLRQAHDALIYAADRVVLDDPSVWMSVRTLRNNLSSRLEVVEPILPHLLDGTTHPDLVAQWHHELAVYVGTMDASLANLAEQLR